MVAAFSAAVLAGALVTGIAAQPEEAGRAHHIGETVPPTIQKALAHDVTTSRWSVGVVVFVRSNHEYSERLLRELEQLRQAHRACDSIPFWLVSTTPGDPRKELSVLKSEWHTVHDSIASLSQLFGIRVAPSIFLLSYDWKILGYLPGFGPESMLKLRANLSPYHPSLALAAGHSDIGPHAKSRNLREELAQRLFEQHEYDNALSVLKALDSLSPAGHRLLGMTHLGLGHDSLSRVELLSALANPAQSNMACFGLGILEFRRGRLDSAQNYLEKIRIMPGMHGVRYCLGRILEEKGDLKSALVQYRAALEYVEPFLVPALGQHSSVPVKK